MAYKEIVLDNEEEDLDDLDGLPPIDEEDSPFDDEDEDDADDGDVSKLADEEEEESDPEPVSAGANDAEVAALRARTQDLEAKLSNSEKVKIDQYKVMIAAEEERIKSEDASLKALLKRAIDDGDAEKQVEITDKLSDLKVRKYNVDQAKREVENYKPQAPAAQPQKVNLHPNTERWVRTNKWFNDPKHQDAAKYALYIAGTLEASGVGADKPEYWQKVDEAVRRAYPEVKAETKKKTDKAAPVSRAGSPTAKKQKVVLDADQVKFARKYGIDLKEFAREQAKLKRAES